MLSISRYKTFNKRNETKQQHQSKNTVPFKLKWCCGAGAGGAKIIWDLEPEPKLNF